MSKKPPKLTKAPIPQPTIPVHEGATLVDVSQLAFMFPGTSPSSLVKWLDDQLGVPTCRFPNGRRYYLHQALGAAIFERMMPGQPDLMGPGYPSRYWKKNRKIPTNSKKAFMAFWCHCMITRCTSLPMALAQIAEMLRLANLGGVDFAPQSHRRAQDKDLEKDTRKALPTAIRKAGEKPAYLSTHQIDQTVGIRKGRAAKILASLRLQPEKRTTRGTPLYGLNAVHAVFAEVRK